MIAGEEKTTNCTSCGSNSKPIFSTQYGETPKVAGVALNLNQRPWIFECLKCGLRFAFPPVPQEKLFDCYEKAGTSVWHDDPHNDERRGFPEMVRLLNQGPIDKSVLDVGCYTGSFLNCFPDDWKKYGIEPSIDASKIARSRNIQIIGRDINEVNLLSKQFGCVASLSVLEHMPDPRTFINALVDKVLPGGLLLLQTGDIYSVYARFMGQNWCYYHIPEHISFFSQASLTKLLQSLGLELLFFKRNIFHKRPFGIKPWIKRITLTAGEVGRAAFFSLVKSQEHKYKEQQKRTWITWYDHMFCIARKKNISTNEKN